MFSIFYYCFCFSTESTFTYVLSSKFGTDLFALVWGQVLCCPFTLQKQQGIELEILSFQIYYLSTIQIFRSQCKIKRSYLNRSLKYKISIYWHGFMLTFFSGRRSSFPLSFPKLCCIRTEVGSVVLIRQEIDENGCTAFQVLHYKTGLYWTGKFGRKTSGDVFLSYLDQSV